MDILFVIIVAIVGSYAVSQLKDTKRSTKVSKSFPSTKRVYKTSPIVEPSHVFHSPNGEIGEDHVDVIGRKHISHPEPSQGYVVLNGVERKLEDCKWL